MNDSNEITVEQTEKLIQSIRLLDEFFDADAMKVALWLNAVNPFLGNARPLDLFFRCRGHKVLKFIESARMEDSK